MNVCDYCGARMQGNGQGMRDTCPNGCDDLTEGIRAANARRVVERQDARSTANAKAIAETAREYDGPRLRSPGDP